MKKGLIFYGITSPKKHVDTKHSFITQMFEEEMNSLLRRIEEKQLLNKKANPSNESIFKFFSIKNMFKKNNVSHKELLEDLGLLVIKKKKPI
jgi:hypothetical protein